MAEFPIWCARIMTVQPEETLVTLVKFVRNRPTGLKAVMHTNFNIEKHIKTKISEVEHPGDMHN